MNNEKELTIVRNISRVRDFFPDLFKSATNEILLSERPGLDFNRFTEALADNDFMEHCFRQSQPRTLLEFTNRREKYVKENTPPLAPPPPPAPKKKAKKKK